MSQIVLKRGNYESYDSQIRNCMSSVENQVRLYYNEVLGIQNF